MVLPYESLSVKSKYPNIRHTDAYFAERTLLSASALESGSARAVTRLLQAELTH